MNRMEIKIGSVYDWGNPPRKEPSDPAVRRVMVISDLGPGKLFYPSANPPHVVPGQEYSLDAEQHDWKFEVEDVETKERFPSDKRWLFNAARAGDLQLVPQPSTVP